MIKQNLTHNGMRQTKKQKKNSPRKGTTNKNPFLSTLRNPINTPNFQSHAKDMAQIPEDPVHAPLVHLSSYEL